MCGCGYVDVRAAVLLKVCSSKWQLLSHRRFSILVRRPPLFLFLRCIHKRKSGDYCECKSKRKNGGGLGMRLRVLTLSTERAGAIIANL